MPGCYRVCRWMPGPTWPRQDPGIEPVGLCSRRADHSGPSDYNSDVTHREPPGTPVGLGPTRAPRSRSVRTPQSRSTWTAGAWLPKIALTPRVHLSIWLMESVKQRAGLSLPV